MRSIGNPDDNRLTLGGVPQAVNIPGLPPTDSGYGVVQGVLPGMDAVSGRIAPSDIADDVTNYLMQQERLGRTRTAQLQNRQIAAQEAVSGPQAGPVQGEINLFPVFKADPTRVGGSQTVGSAQGPARAVRRLMEAGEAEAARKQGIWWSSKNAGIEPVTRGDADFVDLRDSQVLTDRLGELGRWVPTSNVDAKRLEEAAAATQGVSTGSGDSRRRDDAPLRRRPGKVRAEEIDQVLAALEAQGVTDPRQDPRFLEMEEAARFVRSIPRREGYEGDPSQIGSGSSGGKSWGGINPYGPIELLTSDARGQLRPVNVYPGEQTGLIRTIDPDATAIWDREEDPNFARLAQEAQREARTDAITGIALEQLARQGRFREASPTELQVLAPKREGAANTLKGFMVQAGSQPITANQLLQAIAPTDGNGSPSPRLMVDRYGAKTPVEPARLMVNRDGALIPVDPAGAAAGFNRVLSVALDPQNPEITIGQGGRFSRESQLPELYLQKPDGTVSRLAMAVSTEGEPSLLLREWSPVYDPGVETQVERAERNSLGQPTVVPRNTPLYRVGRSTNQDNDVVKERLREILPGVGAAIQLTPRMGVRPLLQGQQRGDYSVVMRSGDQTRVLAPQEVESELNALVGRAMDPGSPEVGIDPVSGVISTPQRMPNSIPQFLIQRPDGSQSPIAVSVRSGPNPEPLVQLPVARREIGPTFLNSSIDVRMRGARRDPGQDLYPVLNELTSAAFSENAPIGSTQRATRELMAGLVRQGRTPAEAANLITEIVAKQSSSPTVREDYRNALKSAVIELTGGESRLPPPEPAAPASYAGLAEVLDFARGLNQQARSPRVVPPGDVRERLRPRVRLAAEGDSRPELGGEMFDPIQQALADEMAARAFAGYGRSGNGELDLNDLDSDAYLTEGLGRGADSGIPGESPRVPDDAELDVPTFGDAVTASAFKPLASSSLVGQRSMSELGPIENALKRQAQLLADAAIRRASATSRPVITERTVSSPEGPRVVRTRQEARTQGLTPEQIQAVAARMAAPNTRSGSMQEWVNFGNGWSPY